MSTEILIEVCYVCGNTVLVPDTTFWNGLCEKCTQAQIIRG